MGAGWKELPGTVVYPGHPVVIALNVVLRFESYAAAIKVAKGKTCPASLGDMRVPGSGGCGYLALALLKKLRDDVPWPEVMAWADEAWGRVDGQAGVARYKERWKAGQEQADYYKPELFEKRKWWSR